MQPYRIQVLGEGAHVKSKEQNISSKILNGGCESPRKSVEINR